MNIGVNWRLVDQNKPTGVQNYVVNLYNQIGRFNTKYNYFKLSTNSADNLLSNIYFDNWLIKKQLKTTKVNLYHSPAITLPVGKKVCPYVATIHDLAFKALPQFGHKLHLAYFDFTVRNVLQKADVIITDSKFTKSELAKYYDVKEVEIKVVPLGIDAYFFKKEKKSYLAKLKKEYNLADKKVVYTNSVHSKRKNISSLIKAFKNSNLADTVLVIAGNKNGLKLLDRQNIRNVGYLTKRENRAMYQICDLFVYPSLYEGFGLPVLEAMASETIVLSSDIPPLRELIPSRKFLFKPQSINEIKEKIKYYLEISDQEKQEIKKKYNQVLGDYTWEKTAKKTLEVFKKFQ